MKSRKEIAELANEYIAEFDAAYVPKNERIERIIAYGKKSLKKDRLRRKRLWTNACGQFTKSF